MTQEITLSEKDVARFWSKVDRRGPDECWLWMAGTDKDGYGKFQAKKKSIRSHRLALGLTTGGIREGKLATHSCDTPTCCNPSHLSWGTVQSNAQDRVDRGRQGRGSADHHGESNPCSRLTNSQIIEIREKRRSGVILRLLSEEYGVTMTMISRICRYKSWSHIR